MTVGRGGTLWVTAIGEAVGRDTGPEVIELVPGGSEHRFPISDRVERLGQIVAGADGNLWFAEEGAEARLGEEPPSPTRIARLTPSGQITSWPVGSPEQKLLGLAASADGIWFTLGENEVGRVSYQGQIATFSSGIPDGAFPDGITKGPGGAIWFAELGADAIGRVTATGKISQFAWGLLGGGGAGAAKRLCEPCLPGGADSIASGSDETLWFSRPGTDEFGRLSVSPHCSVPNLVGSKISDTESRLMTAGCRLARHRAGPGSFVVASQSAPAGSLLRRGTAISVRGVPPSTARRGCAPEPGQRVVTADGGASLLATLKPTVPGSPATPFRYLVCVDRRNGPHRVRQIEETLGGGGYSGDTPGLFTMAGDYLAWQQTSTSYDVPYAGITILDGRTGEVKQTEDLSPFRDFNGGGTRATAIALDKVGDVGWLLEQFGGDVSPAQAEGVQVRTQSGVRTIESGERGSLGSLRIAPAGTLDWTHDGTQHSYVFQR